MTVLQTKGITKQFGGILALSNVEFSVNSKEFVALIGPNGAGKSTLLNILTGLAAPTAGRIEFNGADVTRAAPHQRIRQGLGRTFQHGRLFPRLSVVENVMTGAANNSAKGNRELRDISMHHLEQMGLARFADHSIAGLSYGTRRMIELTRALAGGPQLLLLDEPAAGLNSGEVEKLVAQLRTVHAQQDLAIVLIEHNMGMVMRLAERIVVLNFGNKIAEGTPAEVRRDPAVLSAYLGEGFGDAGV